MRDFANLLDQLVLTPSRNAKLRLMIDYFSKTPDPDRGLAVAAITRDLNLVNVKPALLRSLIEERMDPVLFRHSYDYVGDLAETISLVWRPKAPPVCEPGSLQLSEIIDALQTTTRQKAPETVSQLLDKLDVATRWAFLKLVTGGLRIGVSSRLVKQALADFGAVEVTEIEELWHGLDPPYVPLFQWLEGKAEKPVNLAPAPFRPAMLAHPLAREDRVKIKPEIYAAEWKWDGIRVQAVRHAGTVRLYSRTGDDISHAFPDITAELDFDATIDGELLVRNSQQEGNGLIDVAPFGSLQQRLNRKTTPPKLLNTYPAFIRAYDILHHEDEDLRPLPFCERRQHLVDLLGTNSSYHLDISPLIAYSSINELAQKRAKPPHSAIEGVMLKRWDSCYVPGRPKGPWFKWKQDPYLIDAVLMYAQRGHGKRSSFYSDYTFGVWRGAEQGDELVPVGKAYSGFSDEELLKIDKYVRDNTVERYGPVRAVRADEKASLVFEVAFEGLNHSTRHKSGIAMRFPRISRLRWDKPAREADRLETLMQLLEED